MRRDCRPSGLALTLRMSAHPSRPQTSVKPVQPLAVIHPVYAAQLVRQQRLDDRPLEIPRLVAAGLCSSSSLETGFTSPAVALPIYEPLPGIGARARGTGDAGTCCVLDMRWVVPTRHDHSAAPAADIGRACPMTIRAVTWNRQVGGCECGRTERWRKAELWEREPARPRPSVWQSPPNRAIPIRCCHEASCVLHRLTRR